MPTAAWFGQALVGQYGTTAARRVDWVTDTIKVTLHTSATVPDQDAHDFYDDLSATEIAATGTYATGGATLATKSVGYIAATNRAVLIAADVTWTGITATFRYGIIRKDTGAAATSPLLGYVDLGAQSITASDYTLDADQVNGWLYLAAT